jgi:hypothetical protein
MMLATPKLIESQLIETFNQMQIVAELQHRMFSNRVVGREKRAKTQTGHRYLRARKEIAMLDCRSRPQKGQAVQIG